jgi:hypothetical protein
MIQYADNSFYSQPRQLQLNSKTTQSQGHQISLQLLNQLHFSFCVSGKHCHIIFTAVLIPGSSSGVTYFFVPLHLEHCTLAGCLEDGTD